MAKARRKRRGVTWCSAAGLCLTLIAAGCSEFAALSWLEEQGGVPNRFLLFRSGVTVIYRFGNEPKIDWLGRELFQPGWSVERSSRVSEVPRRWLPQVSRSTGTGFERWYAVLPLWIPAVLFGAGTWWGLRGRWTGVGVCAQCGYDLKGLSDGESGTGVCPECGRATASVA